MQPATIQNMKHTTDNLWPLKKNQQSLKKKCEAYNKQPYTKNWDEINKLTLVVGSAS